MEKGIIDSTGVLELLGFIEEEFRIKVEDGEVFPENLDSLQKLTQFIQRKLAHAAQ
jgi:acyl carrier protein